MIDIDKSIKCIAILDNHVQALGIMRLVKNKNYVIKLFNKDKSSISKYSKYCNEFIVYKGEVELLNLLVENVPSGALMIPTNDRMIKFCLDNYDVLNSNYNLIVMDYKNTELCYNKRKLFEMYGDSSVPVPVTIYADIGFDYKQISYSLPYPVIIKPAVMHTFKKKTGKKALRCDGSEEFCRNYKYARSVINEDEIMIQELLEGGARNLFSYCAFVVNGRPYGKIIANRIRQHPMDFGNSTTYAITVENKVVEKLAETLLDKMNYTGICEVEFMFDNKTQTYKLLEINPRFWKWHGLAQKVGINYIDIILDYMSGRSISDESAKHRAIWRERISDTIVSLQEILAGRMSLSGFLKSNRYPVQYACWDKKDPMPALMYLLKIPILRIKRR